MADCRSDQDQVEVVGARDVRGEGFFAGDRRDVRRRAVLLATLGVLVDALVETGDALLEGVNAGLQASLPGNTCRGGGATRACRRRPWRLPAPLSAIGHAADGAVPQQHLPLILWRGADVRGHVLDEHSDAQVGLRGRVGEPNAQLLAGAVLFQGDGHQARRDSSLVARPVALVQVHDRLADGQEGPLLRERELDGHGELGAVRQVEALEADRLVTPRHIVARRLGNICPPRREVAVASH
mmetsp:Transcript_47475/g.146795  ORF Transcript_47475/g.146795 Transcript_47475/m.146795 type:complete len:240 (+) Transcript_47475:59-778(+)